MDNNNISVIGIGRLGLCTALVFENGGYNVVGVDIRESYIKSINNKTFYSDEPHVNDFLHHSQNFRATTSLDEALDHSDIIYILVATPTGVGEKSYDHTYLSSVLQQINNRRVTNKHIIIGCTVLPGYIANIGRFLLKDCDNCTLNYNPEFIAQGNIIDGLINPDMVLIGEENESIGDIIESIYVRITDNNPKISRMTPESAEITKLAVNCFITTKIAFANMIGDIADKTHNANAIDILSAVGNDSRIGNKCLRPGYGFGGPCFPRDNRALGNYARTIGVPPIIPESTDKSNIEHAKHLAQQIIDECYINGATEYTFTDVAYKPQCPVPIIEESHPLIVAKLVTQHGIIVTIQDRKNIIEQVQKEYGQLFKYKIV